MYAIKHARLEWAALGVGLAAAGLLVLGWSVEGGVQAPAASLELVAASSDRLAVAPAGVTSERGALRASDGEVALERTLAVRNPSDGPLAIRVVATPETGDLDAAVAVSVAANGRTIFHGGLADLRRGSKPFGLAAHEEASVAIRAWIPAEEREDDWLARSESVRIDLTTETPIR